MAFELPELPYAYDALKESIDTRTMKIHHTKHHQGYTNKLNAAIEGTDLEKLSIVDLMKKAGSNPGVRNNGGGYYNHSLFWKIMSPEGGGAPKGKMAKLIKDNFGTFDKFKEAFAKAAGTRFGSGWAWLAVKRSGKLFITSTPNQDNPLMDCAENKGIPILGLDVWEHAYYLKYQNKRPDYVANFFNVVNWSQVSRNYSAAMAPKTKKKATKKKK
ncbi:superoxide dismutase [Mn]-like [Stigmatopora argus]